MSSHRDHIRSQSDQKWRFNKVFEAGPAGNHTASRIGAPVAIATANLEAPLSMLVHWANRRITCIAKFVRLAPDHFMIMLFLRSHRKWGGQEWKGKSFELSDKTKMAALSSGKDERWLCEFRCFYVVLSSFLTICADKLIFFRHLEWTFSWIVFIHCRLGIADAKMTGFPFLISFLQSSQRDHRIPP